MNGKQKLLVSAITLLLVFSAAFAFATIYGTKTVGNQGSVIGDHVQLWRMNPSYLTGVNEITTVQWGNSLANGATYSSNTLYGVCFKLKNVASQDEWVAWSLDPSAPLPTGFSLAAKYCSSGNTQAGYTWTPLAQNDYSLIFIQAGMFSGTPSDGNIGRIEFDLTLNGAPSGAFSFNILLKSASSSSG